MTKRYVFWRTPEGRPSDRTGDKHAPMALLSRIGTSSTVNPDGTISWPFDTRYSWSEIVAQMAAIVIDPDGNELNETDTGLIIAAAIKAQIKATGGAKPILGESLLKTADTIAASFFREPVTDYVLITSMSVKELPAKKIHVRGCVVRPIPPARNTFPLPSQMGRRHKELASRRGSGGYTAVKVTTKGRSVSEAVDNALDALHLLRGLWTLIGTYGSVTFHLSPEKPSSIGVIHIGPIHTLHNIDGTLAVDTYWYEPEYIEDQPIYQPQYGWSKIEKGRKWAQRQLLRHPFASDVVQLVIRYALALDHFDFGVAFLRMWAILERLTNTVGSKYDVTVERAVWGFRDRLEIKEILEHLRLQRNQWVHAARSGAQNDQLVYMVKTFVEPHLMRLIANTFRVDTLLKYGDFLGLPSDVDKLERRRETLNRAIKMLKPGKPQNVTNGETKEQEDASEPKPRAAESD